MLWSLSTPDERRTCRRLIVKFLCGRQGSRHPQPCGHCWAIRKVSGVRKEPCCLFIWRSNSSSPRRRLWKPTARLGNRLNPTPASVATKGQTPVINAARDVDILNRPTIITTDLFPGPVSEVRSEAVKAAIYQWPRTLISSCNANREKLNPSPGRPCNFAGRVAAPGRKIEAFTLHCVSVHANMPPCCYICSLTSRAPGCLDFL